MDLRLRGKHSGSVFHRSMCWSWLRAWLLGKQTWGRALVANLLPTEVVAIGEWGLIRTFEQRGLHLAV